MDILEKSARMQQRAHEVIREAGIIEAWESIGAEPNLIGSVRTGLIIKHRDIDFHIYSAPLTVSDSFAAMARLADNPRISRLEYANGMETDERCLEWHVRYLDRENEWWKFDMIHIEKGSRYDGHMERVSERIEAALTPETRRAILQIKQDTPDEAYLPGIFYYVAVLRDGIRDYAGFTEWRKHQPLDVVIDWIP